MKLIKRNQDVVVSKTVVNTVNLERVDMPDYGSLTGYKLVESQCAVAAGDYLAAIANGVIGYGYAITPVDQSVPTDLLSLEGIITMFGYSDYVAAGAETPHVWTRELALEHDPVLEFQLGTYFENVTLGPTIMIVRLVYDVYKLTQAEYIEAM